MDKLIEQFLEHLRYERNVSEHTLRNYSSDLEQFITYLSPDKKQLPLSFRDRSFDHPRMDGLAS